MRVTVRDLKSPLVRLSEIVMLSGANASRYFEK